MAVYLLLLPFICRIGTIEGILELNHMPILLFQLVPALCVVLHQLSQRGKFLPSVQVKVIARVLDFNVGDFSVPPANKNK